MTRTLSAIPQAHVEIKKALNVNFQGFFMFDYFKLLLIGGDNRDRTDDLLNAIQALSQLSYIPMNGRYNKMLRP